MLPLTIFPGYIDQIFSAVGWLFAGLTMAYYVLTPNKYALDGFIASIITFWIGYWTLPILFSIQFIINDHPVIFTIEMILLVVGFFALAWFINDRVINYFWDVYGFFSWQNLLVYVGICALLIGIAATTMDTLCCEICVTELKWEVETDAQPIKPKTCYRPKELKRFVRKNYWKTHTAIAYMTKGVAVCKEQYKEWDNRDTLWVRAGYKLPRLQSEETKELREDENPIKVNKSNNKVRRPAKQSGERKERE